ncbi:MAG: acetate--CoA ligase family protein [Aestuariivirga sp.]
MNDKRRVNLQRLMKPRHVTVVGGRDVETVAGECARIGFNGPFWPVNPKRSHIGGHICYPTVEQLPEAPDAVFLAVPKEAAIETLAKLNAMGAGGVICYTAGFGETGKDGAQAESRLVEAAGDMALVGPNCYGVINYVDRVALWPFAHGGTCPGYGAAIITQSGMLSSDFTMSQRSLPLAYMVSAGNQTVVRLEDFIDVLCDRDEVRAFGLHIEGLKDVARFERAALKSLERGKPIVAFKTGTSRLGSKLTISHTGSLSGTEELYDALFDRLGIIRAASPVQMLETVKLLTICGAPKGNRLAGLTCSGGGATMLADYAELNGLDFPVPAVVTAQKLRELLPETATVTNPLDYTTPIWGMPEKTRPAFETMFSDGYDAAVIVQDYPAAGLDESKVYYRNDTESFIAAAMQHGLPACVCSTLPENLDAETREFLVANDVAPMQGIQECATALGQGAWYSRRRTDVLANRPSALITAPTLGPNRLLDEAEAKALLRLAAIAVPDGRVADGDNAAKAAQELGFPVALKMMSPQLPHKTEAGAVRLGLRSGAEVVDAITAMRTAVRTYKPEALTDRFLVERMSAPPVAEILLSVRRDPQFGFAMTIASGGVLVELLADATTLLLPAVDRDFERALSRLKISRLLDGYRGKPAGDRRALLDTIQRIAHFAVDPKNAVAEIEINPIFVHPQGVCAVDVLLQVTA